MKATFVALGQPGQSVDVMERANDLFETFADRADKATKDFDLPAVKENTKLARRAHNLRVLRQKRAAL